jgi:predicted RNA polymerase sigma factor
VTPLETALRDDWGRLLALLVAQFRRLDLAERSHLLGRRAMRSGEIG